MSSLSRRISSHVPRPFRASESQSSSPTRESGSDDEVIIFKTPSSRFGSVSDISVYYHAIKGMVDGVGIDDRELLLEKLLVLMARNKEHHFSLTMQKGVINLLYNDLPHPPTGYLGLLPTRNPALIKGTDAHVKYAFRPADGSNNNPLYPTLGQAGSPYARSVPSTRIAPKAALPDPGLVFDTLLKRDTFTPHPGGLSALFFSFADLVIHSLFNTDRDDWSINRSSSYLDLSILYGNSDTDVDAVRRKDGTGRLWEDTFSDKRLLFMPPASCALLVLLSRNHNYICQKILDINENGNLKQPVPTEEKARDAQDEEIFQRARLVNCGFFIHIVLGDYVGAILGLVRDGSDWRLDPLMIMREIDHEFTPTGQGNVVSMEFNQLYRWHATLSREDTEWTNKVFTRVLGGKDPKDLTVKDFKDRARAAESSEKEKPNTYVFGGIQRDENGRFKDSDLANILLNSTDSRAAAFKARGVPEIMRVVEIMGIMQSRTWSTCSLNEFRKFIGLKPYATFEEWNPDKDIYTVAQTLYKDIDNLELCVGLQAEQAKEPMGGAGLCPGYTLSRAILADAVCLVRGDRFLTTELTPYNLTSWGYQDTRYDTQDGSYGGLLTRLLFRTLPDHYPRGSAYAHFPFLVPSWFKKFLSTQRLEMVEKYTWNRPAGSAPAKPIDTYTGVKEVVTGSDFVSSYDRQAFTLVKPVLDKSLSKETLKSLEKLEKASTVSQKTLAKGTVDITKSVFTTALEEDAAAYFCRKIDQLVKEKTFPHAGSSVTYVDIIKDVVNLLPVHWISRTIGLPLKTKSNPGGLWDEQETYDMFADISRYIYLNFDPSYDWHLRESAQAHTVKILESLKTHVDKIDSWLGSSDTPGLDGHNSSAFLRKVWQQHGKNCTHREFAAQLFSALVPTAALFSQAVAHVVDYYLGGETSDMAKERAHIVELHKSTEKDAKEKVLGYVLEALRLSPPVAGVYRTAAKEVDFGDTSVEVGEKVYASLIKANADAAFGSVDYARPLEKGKEGKPDVIIAFNEFGLMRTKFFETTVPGIVGTILSLPDLKRGPGPSGSLNRFFEKQHGTIGPQYINSKGGITPWPDSLLVQYSVGAKST